MAYRIGRNETPQDVALLFTGDRMRATELIAANPGVLGRVKTPGGQQAIDPVSWRQGETIELPASWSSGAVGAPSRPNKNKSPRVQVPQQGGGIVRGAVGAVPGEGDAPEGEGGDTGAYGILAEEAEAQASAQGTGCPPGAITAVKPYRLLVKDGDWPDALTRTWFGDAYYGKRTLQLLGANPQTAPKLVGVSCNATKFWAGMALKIPANWPLPPKSFEDEGRLVNDDGTKYVPPTGGDYVEPDVPGDENVDRVDWGRGGGGDGMGVWGVLGIGAAVAGALFLGYTFTKKRG